MTTKWHWTLQVKYIPYMCYQYPNFTLFYSTIRSFQDPAILRQVHQMTQKWPWKADGTPFMCYNYPQVPKFQPVLFTTSRFRDTGHFETSAPNDSKWAWTRQGQLCTHKCVTSIRECRISVLRPAIFEIQAILRQVHLGLQNYLKPYKVKCTPYMSY